MCTLFSSWQQEISLANNEKDTSISKGKSKDSWVLEERLGPFNSEETIDKGSLSQTFKSFVCYSFWSPAIFCWNGPLCFTIPYLFWTFQGECICGSSLSWSKFWQVTSLRARRWRGDRWKVGVFCARIRGTAFWNISRLDWLDLDAANSFWRSSCFSRTNEWMNGNWSPPLLHVRHSDRFCISRVQCPQGKLKTCLVDEYFILVQRTVRQLRVLKTFIPENSFQQILPVFSAFLNKADCCVVKPDKAVNLLLIALRYW